MTGPRPRAEPVTLRGARQATLPGQLSSITERHVAGCSGLRGRPAPTASAPTPCTRCLSGRAEASFQRARYQVIDGRRPRPPAGPGPYKLDPLPYLAADHRAAVFGAGVTAAHKEEEERPEHRGADGVRDRPQGAFRAQAPDQDSGQHRRTAIATGGIMWAAFATSARRATYV
jgi:hypothetical protein